MQWIKYCWGAIEKKSILLLHYWKILHFGRAPKNIFWGAQIIYSSTLQRWQSFRKLHKGQGVWDGHVGYLMKLNIIGRIQGVTFFCLFFSYVLVTLLNLTCNQQKYYLYSKKFSWPNLNFPLLLLKYCNSTIFDSYILLPIKLLLFAFFYHFFTSFHGFLSILLPI